MMFSRHVYNTQTSFKTRNRVVDTLNFNYFQHCFIIERLQTITSEPCEIISAEIQLKLTCRDSVVRLAPKRCKAKYSVE